MQGATVIGAVRFISVIERSLGMKAEIEFEPLQFGDLKETYGDTGPLRREFGFEPKTSIDEGIPPFIECYREHYNL